MCGIADSDLLPTALLLSAAFCLWTNNNERYTAATTQSAITDFAPGAQCGGATWRLSW